MQLQYSGTIAVPVGEAWTALSDLNRVAGCVPGVRLDAGASGEEVAGTVTVPLGPLRLTYRGEASFVERDEQARRVVIDATGRDSHGEQAASARITAQLHETSPGTTEVTAVADVNVRGMSAPVGFAVGEFGTGLLKQFVTRLGAVERATAAATGSRSGGGAGQPGTSRDDAPSAFHGAAASSEAAPAEPPPPAHTAEEAIYPVPPPGEGSSHLVPLASSMAVGVLLGWLLGRRRKR